MFLKKKKKADAEARRKEDATWFYQFWPDIRKQLVATMFTAISIGIVTLVVQGFSQVKMEEEFAEMKVTIRKVDSSITLLSAQNQYYLKGIHDRDSIIKILIDQNKEILNQFSKK